MRTALILIALIWLPLIVLCSIEGLAFSGVKLPFFYDLAAHTKFLIAVPVLALSDIPVGARLRGFWFFPLKRGSSVAHTVSNAWSRE